MDVRVSAGAATRVVFAAVLVPPGLGIAVRRLRPRFAARAPIVEHKHMGMALLVVGLLPILAAAWPMEWALVGNGTVLAMAAVAGVGLVAGHLLGGPDPDDRTALALAGASRHPAVALLIGNPNFPGQQVGAAVVLYLVVASSVSAAYGAWRTRGVAVMAA